MNFAATGVPLSLVEAMGSKDARICEPNTPLILFKQFRSYTASRSWPLPRILELSSVVRNINHPDGGRTTRPLACICNPVNPRHFLQTSPGTTQKLLASGLVLSPGTNSFAICIACMGEVLD